MGFKHKLSNGRVFKVIEGILDGLCEEDEKLITIGPTLKGQYQLEVFIHELLHAEFPEKSEADVDRRAKSLASYLWKAGYRRKKK